MLIYDSDLILLKKWHYTLATAGSSFLHHISEESWVSSKICKIYVQYKYSIPDVLQLYNFPSIVILQPLVFYSPKE